MTSTARPVDRVRAGLGDQQRAQRPARLGVPGPQPLGAGGGRSSIPAGTESAAASHQPASRQGSSDQGTGIDTGSTNVSSTAVVAPAAYEPSEAAMSTPKPTTAIPSTAVPTVIEQAVASVIDAVPTATTSPYATSRGRVCTGGSRKTSSANEPNAANVPNCALSDSSPATATASGTTTAARTARASVGRPGSWARSQATTGRTTITPSSGGRRHKPPGGPPGGPPDGREWAHAARHLFEPEHDAFRDLVRTFLARRGGAARTSAGRRPASSTARSGCEAGAAGLLGFDVPEEYGGGGVPDFRFNAVLDEEIVRDRRDRPRLRRCTTTSSRRTCST